MPTKITANNIVLSTLQTSSISVPKVSDIVYGDDDLATSIDGGQTIVLNGSGFASGCQVLIDGTYANSVTFANSAVISFVSPAKTAGTYPLYVVNPDGGTAIVIPGISYGGTPSFSTGAGSVGSEYETLSFTANIVATSDSAVTYAVSSGSLPGGLSLNTNTGVITGTLASIASQTTYNFTIKASDAELQDTSRTFNITVLPDSVTWNSPANNTTITQYETLGVSQTLNANSYLGKSITYTANVLPGNLSISGNTITGNLTAGAANTVSLITATSSQTNKTATRTIQFAVNPDVVTWNSPANNTTISQYEHSSVNQALSASSLLGYSISYAANSLPTGVTISGSNITGTLPGTATTANSSSLITATSATTNRTATRNINFSILPDVVTWSSPANGSTYNVNTNDSASIALSASSAAGRSISYSATGLPSGLSISGSNITGTYTGSGSSTATITATAATTGKTANRTLNFNVTAPFNITYLTQKNQFINPQSNGYLVSHPAGVQAGDLCVLFHATHSQPPAGEYFLQDAPSGFTFVSYRFDAGIGGGIRAANLASYRVLPNTNDIALPGVRPFGGSDIAGTGATVFCAFYFRPNRSISSVTVGSLNQGLNIFGSGSSYPSGSGEAYPDLKSGTSTVSPSGQTAPVVVLGGSFVPGSGYTHTFSSSPAFDGTVGPVTGDGMANFIGGYKLYQTGTSPANHTMTYGPNDGFDKILLSFFLRVS